MPRPTAVPPPLLNPDPGVAWHYGDPLREQRMLASGEGAVDLSNRGVLTVSGVDRLKWLHDITTQHLSELTAGESRLSLILSPQGHVEDELHIIDDGLTTWIITQPNAEVDLFKYLNGMRFMLRVDLANVTKDYAVVWQPQWESVPKYPTWLMPPDFAGEGRMDAGSDRGGDALRYVAERPAAFRGREVIVPMAELDAFLGDDVAGTWALEALRIAAAVPRVGRDTDHRTLPHEVGWIGPAVHLSKGCYRGQEAVARVHNLGHAPRRLVLLHLDGSEEELPRHEDQVWFNGQPIGFIGSAAQHYELGPIATAVINRKVEPDGPVRVPTRHNYINATVQNVVTP